MGYPAGWVTDVLDSRNAALRCLGNAVVPQVAEAFTLGLLGEDALTPVNGELLPTPTASYGEGGKHARNLTWDGNTAYRPSGAKASVSLLEALDRPDMDGAA